MFWGNISRFFQDFFLVWNVLKATHHDNVMCRQRKRVDVPILFLKFLQGPYQLDRFCQMQDNVKHCRTRRQSEMANKCEDFSLDAHVGVDYGHGDGGEGTEGLGRKTGWPFFSFSLGRVGRKSWYMLTIYCGFVRHSWDLESLAVCPFTYLTMLRKYFHRFQAK